MTRTGSEAAPVLEVRDLCLSFGAIQVARNISFDLSSGDRLALIGPNGAGKTTLINMLTGALKPSSGSARLAGRNLLALKPHERVRAGLGRTYQITSLFRAMTVFENLFIAVSERLGTARNFWRPAWSRGEVCAEVERILETVSLSDVGGERVSDLPYGRQRLVELGLALALRPKVLLLDEPAAGIPHREAEVVQQAVDQLPPDIAVILVEHDMDLVFRFAREILVLVEGAVLRQGTPDEIAADPEVKRIYLGSAA
ncbi:ABC transporter ATP-binding protein [Amorphus orientalis]|uniref:ABC-type branched-subunit amino acid transport system ATPase component n=1 Tax=Amorphus orientalis TaxID=649198 RepID=A0AAE4ASW4_9HYPH|nr:ABC transporter ATP-binding protein [Amorphus orientalis]MDQ0314399.1 ABC-type branched-subunit amino acid transport system ATPase component [Amorphus orientalis]